MENQYFELRSEGVAARGALAARGVNADGNIPGSFFWDPGVLFRREREHVSWLILAAEPLIQIADGLVRGEQHGDFAAE